MKFLTANWTDLLIINYEVNPEILNKYIPKGTEIDLWNNKAYISLVGFMFENVKVFGLKIPLHTTFEEVNLRFYVKRFENHQWKRGVVFIKEIVPRQALTWVANTIYKEHYHTTKMQHYKETSNEFNNLKYDWQHKNNWNSICVKAGKNLLDIPEDSEAAFITEHYFGYTKVDANTTYEYEVKHPKWQQYHVQDYKIAVDFESVYGADFKALKDKKPESVNLVKGSKISVHTKIKIK
ncbi:YqjF family protein [Flavobacterium branchiophilum]|uniref:DUF2071 domain-containing protein n=1 Tax=Flavobacterium branchiophilum TaxID=55197 RepID=A0A2H3KDJ1_9FLAO|nr:DUF2071 domain-containing protein [Flavobacterium branchiophilum]PDS25813.1 hypothetical protein B0A77_04050 [Flavobacterium branchiophilum]